MKIFFVAPFASKASQEWFSVGRFRKINQVCSMLTSLGFDIQKLNIVPFYAADTSTSLVSLCRSKTPVKRFAELLFFALSFFLAQESHSTDSYIWVYNTRAAESLVACLGILLHPRYRLVLELEDLPSARMENHGIRGFADLIMTRFLANRADFVFTVSDPVSKAFTRITGVSSFKIHALPPSLSDSFVNKACSRKQPFSSAVISILYAGSYAESKGVDDLINAALSLDETYFHLHLVGPIPASLRNKYANSRLLTCHGLISTESLFDMYCSADIVVNPHRVVLNPDYIFPFKLIETIASGALPLTTPVPGYESFNLPDVCLFRSVNDLLYKLVNSKLIWATNRHEIISCAQYCIHKYSFSTILQSLSVL